MSDLLTVGVVADPRNHVRELSESLADLVSELRLDHLLTKITSHAQGALGAGFVLLVADGDSLRCETASELPAGAIGTIERWANGRPQLLEEPLDVAGPIDGLAIGSLSSAPLRYRGQALGVLLAVRRRGDDFDRDATAILQSFATQVAIALTNARLYEVEQQRARRDPLTALLNHREFHEELSRQLEHCRSTGSEVSVALFDLDDFKRVNDTGGHLAGDRVLRRVGRALLAGCRESDTVFRIGGDEFAMVLPATSIAEAHVAARRAADAIAGSRGGLPMSFGVASWPHDGPTRSSLLGAADRRLYRMKRAPTQGRRAAPPRRDERQQRERLAVASRLSARLAPVLDVAEIARVTVAELHHSFEYYLAVIQRLDPDGMLRIVAAAGPLSEAVADFLAYEQPLADGVNGRVARTGEPALVTDTRLDPDYLTRDPRSDPRSELSVPIRVAGSVWGVLNLEQLAPSAFDVGSSRVDLQACKLEYSIVSPK